MAKGKPWTGNWGLARGGQASARIEIARVCHTSHRTGRPDQAQDGAGQLVGVLLDGEVFDDPLPVDWNDSTAALLGHAILQLLACAGFDGDAEGMF